MDVVNDSPGSNGYYIGLQDTTGKFTVEHLNTKMCVSVESNENASRISVLLKLDSIMWCWDLG